MNAAELNDIYRQLIDAGMPQHPRLEYYSDLPHSTKPNMWALFSWLGKESEENLGKPPANIFIDDEEALHIITGHATQWWQSMQGLIFWNNKEKQWSAYLPHKPAGTAPTLIEAMLMATHLDTDFSL